VPEDRPFPRCEPGVLEGRHRDAPSARDHRVGTLQDDDVGPRRRPVERLAAGLVLLVQVAIGPREIPTRPQAGELAACGVRTRTPRPPTSRPPPRASEGLASTTAGSVVAGGGTRSPAPARRSPAGSESGADTSASWSGQTAPGRLRGASSTSSSRAIVVGSDPLPRRAAGGLGPASVTRRRGPPGGGRREGCPRVVERPATTRASRRFPCGPPPAPAAGFRTRSRPLDGSHRLPPRRPPRTPVEGGHSRARAQALMLPLEAASRCRGGRRCLVGRVGRRPSAPRRRSPGRTPARG